MAFTKVLPVGISSESNLLVDSINSVGVVTATEFVATTGTFSGNVSIAGTLTYEDVTNIDSVGLSTFQNGIHVTGGSVGIGSDNPQNKLDVAGDVKILDNSPRLFFYDANANGASNATGGFEVYDRDGNKNVFCGAFAPNADNLIFGVTGSERARIDSSGNIGIGTDNPIMRLHVHGAANSADSRIRLSSIEGSGLTIRAQSATENNINADSGEDITFSRGNVESLRITSSGNIGIQTNNPYGKLHIGSAAVADAANDVDTTNTSLVIKQSTNNRDDGIYIERSGERRGYYMWINPGGGAGDALTFTRNNLGTKSNALILDRDANAHFGGEVGIGTDNPAAKLEVKSGKIRAGEAGATNGSTIIEGHYSDSNVLNILGSHYSNGATILSYGMRPKNGSSGYVSSFSNFSGGRTALEMWGDGAQIVTAPSQNTAVGSDLTSVTAAVKVNNNGDVTMRGTDSQYIEMASYRTNNGSDIVSNDDDYLEWTEISNTNPSVISHSSSPNPTRITFTVAGVVHFNTHQDIITSGSTSYAQLRIVKNGSIINRSLITNTGGQWDNFSITGVVEVSANDYLEISVQASDITGWDNSGWSSYNFIFAPINTDR